MKALRELLIRTDSIDVRLGNYGENLRRVNDTLYGSKTHTKASDSSQQNASFLQRIDALNFDDTTDDTINSSKSCDHTSFFEVLDEVNSSIAVPDRFIVGANKRVQIVAKAASSSSNNKNTTRMDVSTPAVADKRTNLQTEQIQSTVNYATSCSETVGDKSIETLGGGPSRPNSMSLRVASGTSAFGDLESFYVTPFAPDQTEEEVKQYVIDISNVHSSLVKVTKLVPRGKSVEDLSFVSFKVSVCKSVSRLVSDRWYWPDGITVRSFEPTPKNETAARLPTVQ